MTLVEEAGACRYLGDRSPAFELTLRAEKTLLEAVSVWRLTETGLELPHEVESVHARRGGQLGEGHVLSQAVDQQIARHL